MRVARLGWLFLFVLLFVSVGVSCSLRAPPAQVDLGDETCQITQHELVYQGSTAEGRLDTIYSSCDAVSQGDIADEEELLDVLRGVEAGSGVYRTPVLVRQNDSAYEAFRSRSRAINEDECNCEAHRSINRSGNWTFYDDMSTCPIGGPSCRTEKPDHCTSQERTASTGSVIALVIMLALSAGLGYRRGSIRFVEYVGAALFGPVVLLTSVFLAVQGSDLGLDLGAGLLVFPVIAMAVVAVHISRQRDAGRHARLNLLATYALSILLAFAIVAWLLQKIQWNIL